jgi:pSer/pThr/pTyr-binding forkhead associated (FHA) protein
VDAAFPACGGSPALAYFLPDTHDEHCAEDLSIKDVNVVRITLPYLRILKQYDGFSPVELNGVLRESVALSGERPLYLESIDGVQASYVFFRNGQFYNAGAIRNAQFAETTIREFLVAAGRAGSSGITCFEVDNKMLHSLLILFQKKPALKLLTSLVDLDQVLDKIEEEGKSCIVAAAQDEFLAVLRYERGRVSALYHQHSMSVPHERSFREEFLVKVYTLSAEKPFVISVYEDLLVKYASDARVIDPAYRGSLVDIFVSKPPVITLEFKGKEIGHWMLDKPIFKIGRTAENDIVIDNLAVSRVHSVIEEDKGKHYIRDCDSLNGTIVNGRRIGRTALSDGDEIQIGKHKLVFQKHGAKRIALSPEPEGFDQTVIMRADKLPPPKNAEAGPPSRPRLVDGEGDSVVEIGDSSVTLGKGDAADVEIGGLFVAKRHVEISKVNGRYVLRHVGGRQKVVVEGMPVKEWVLKNNDRIKIGKKEFVFQE